MDNSTVTINDLATIVKGGFDELENTMKDGFSNVDKRFEQVDRRFEQIDKRFEQIDQRFEQIDKRFEDVYSRLDSIDAKLAFIQKEIEDIKGRLADLEKRTIEDSNIFGGDILSLTKRIQVLEAKIEHLTNS